MATPQTSVEEQSAACGHEDDGEHIHRSERPARRTVCVPAADAVSAVAVFAKDVQGDYGCGHERKGSEGQRMTCRQAHEARTCRHRKQSQRDNEVREEDELGWHPCILAPRLVVALGPPERGRAVPFFLASRADEASESGPWPRGRTRPVALLEIPSGDRRRSGAGKRGYHHSMYSKMHETNKTCATAPRARESPPRSRRVRIEPWRTRPTTRVGALEILLPYPGVRCWLWGRPTRCPPRLAPRPDSSILASGDMSAAIVYIDISEVREGAFDELKAGLKDLVDFIEAKEPRLVAYNVYFSADGTRMTVVNVHPDAASLEYHMEVAGPFFRRFVELVTLSSIHIYGEPSEKALELAHEKARLLGGRAVEVEALHVGFTRLTAHAAK